MFDSLTKKFQQLFSGFPKGKLTEENISDAIREVRLALLDADVNYTVASQFIKRVKEKAIGDQIIKSISPGQQFIKIIHDELIVLMGSQESTLQSKSYPSTILLCGLQGSGKTTQSAKLANYLKKKEAKKKVLIAACDLQRPAAIEQLKKLCQQIAVPCFYLEGEKDPTIVAKEAHIKAAKEGFDFLILDTAGRLHIDEPLMKELVQIKTIVNPDEILFVASALFGQDAVKTAQEFDQYLGITGTILTMLDGNARAGAAISIVEVTKKPLKFEGIGEGIEDFQLFNPKSMADRILGMGDVINLVRKAEEQITEEDKKDWEKKLRKASFTYEDYLKQMGSVRKMGPLKNLLKMFPGAQNFDSFDIPEKEFQKMEAMILSMTPDEREEKVELVPSRRRRIAKGSGTTIDDVNRLAKGFKELKKLCKNMPNIKQKLPENKLWH
ncbi:MAG: signal recognition particle protein [Chlamydiae bacterium]|nr:signal recognition particle protein [Chlamydiota bacterium]